MSRCAATRKNSLLFLRNEESLPSAQLCSCGSLRSGNIDSRPQPVVSATLKLNFMSAGARQWKVGIRELFGLHRLSCAFISMSHQQEWSSFASLVDRVPSNANDEWSHPLWPTTKYFSSYGARLVAPSISWLSKSMATSLSPLGRLEYK